MPLYFTREGADRITRQKQELYRQLRKTQGLKGEAAEIGGNQWHDNASFEMLCEEERKLNGQIAEINQKISEMVVLDDDLPNTDKLRIGHLAVLDVDGEEIVYRIGGFEDSDLTADQPVISYLAPIVRKLIGKEEGEEIRVDVNGKVKTVTLMEIKLPGEREE